MENKIKQLEKDNLDLKTKQNEAEIVISEKIDALLNMIKINNPKEDTGLTDPAVPPEVIIEEEKIIEQVNGFTCEICRRELKNKKKLFG